MTKKAGKSSDKPPSKSPSHASRARARLFTASPVHEVIDRICGYIESGMPRASAAALCGVSGEALRARVNEDPEIAAKVLASSAKAEAADVAKLDALIEEGKPTAGQTWKMERLHRHGWNIPTLIQSESRVEVTSLPATADALQRLTDTVRQKEALAAQLLERGSE